MSSAFVTGEAAPSESPRPDQPEAKPTADDFTGHAVNVAVLKETLQHPLTILPMAAAGCGVIVGVAFGMTPGLFLGILGSAGLGGASWIVNFFFRGERLAAAYVQRLRAQRNEIEFRELEAVADACGDASFTGGADAANGLTSAYRKLRSYLLEQLAGGDDATARRFVSLADDTYRQGMAIVHRALEVSNALRGMDVAALERESAVWKKQLRNPASNGREALENRIATYKERIDLYHRREETVQQLLAQATELESALEKAHLEVVTFVGRDGDELMSRGDAASALETAVEAARRIEQRLRGLEHDSATADEEYLAAAKRSEK